MLLSLLLLVGAALAAPATLLAKTSCQKETTVNLSGPWSLPLTALTDLQFCTYYFNVPADSFAVASVLAIDMNSTPYWGETVYFNDQFNSLYQGKSDYSTYNQTTAWGGQFQVNVQTYKDTQFKFQITVTLQKNLRGQKVAQSVSVATDGPSTVLYTADFQEGQTYKVSAQTVANIKATIGISENWNELNKVFVYDNGVFVGSLLNINRDQDFISKSRDVQLYVAKVPLNMKAAVLLTDNSNVALNYAHYLTYVPIDRADRSNRYLLQGGELQSGALTIIGEKDGSTPLTVTDLAELNGNTAAFSYLVGGPLKTRANKEILLNPAQVPKKIGGNVNTFYIARERATIAYNV